MSGSPRLLRPASWRETAASPAAGSQTLRIPVGTITDTLTLATAADGSGRITVTGPGGKVLLTVSQAGQALVGEFGAEHAPVLLVRGDTTACGSGGCSYWAYTFVPSANRVVVVPAPAVPAFRFEPHSRAVLTTVAPMPGGFFGFITPNGQGIAWAERLYDLYQHVQSQEYVYAENGSAAGSWVAVGAPSYSPTERETVPFTSAATTVLGLIQARSLNLPAQGLPLVATGEGSAVWASLAPLARWGASLVEDGQSPSVSESGTSSVVTEEISGTVGSGGGLTLQAFMLTAVVSSGPAPDTFLVQSATLAPVAVPVDTARLALRTAGRAVHRGKIPGPLPSGVLSVFPAGLSWQIAAAGAVESSPWVSVNATTGTVKASGS